VSNWQEASRYELARAWTAIVLSPTVEIAEALLWGESVPHGRLSAWVSRLANRAELPERVYLSDFDSVPS
jgi:hypothetical protein